VVLLRGVFEKKQDCAHNYFITKEYSKLQHVLFKLVSLTPDALLHSPPPCFYSPLGVFFRDRSELLRYDSFNGYRVLKMGFFQYFPEFGEEKKVTGSKSDE